MINLLLNAVQAASQQGEVAFDIGIADNQMQLSVTNNGKTLTDEQIARLFEPFSSLGEGGHGLGLWVTYQIVHQLGGHVGVKRESNNQMHFSVNIPLGRGCMIEKPYRICLIEDDPIMGEALSDRLALEDFECDWFKTGREAMQALTRK